MGVPELPDEEGAHRDDAAEQHDLVDLEDELRPNAVLSVFTVPLPTASKINAPTKFALLPCPKPWASRILMANSARSTWQPFE
eukprot:15485630-Alexandrium_andersonii.AAC.1